MSHAQQREYIRKLKRIHKRFFSNKRVLEVGSLNINGSLRDFFNCTDYTGIDVGDGDGVDLVCQGQDFNAPDESYDVVCSAECFEHNPYWFETFENMVRLCKKGGFVFFTCATEGRPEHGTTKTSPESSPLSIQIGWEYYKNLTIKDFTDRFDFDKHFLEYSFSINNESYDLYFWGIKRVCYSDFSVRDLRRIIKYCSDKLLRFQSSEYQTLVPPDFDLIAYLVLNEDVFLAAVDPYQHYVEHGVSEGRKFRLADILD